MSNKWRAMLGVTALAAYVGTRVLLLQLWAGPNAWMYAGFADVVSVGGNPYTLKLPFGGTLDPQWADYPPIWMVAFGVAAKWMSGGAAVQLVCYVGDALLCIAAFRLACKRAGLDALASMALVVLNPSWLLADVWMAQYKAWCAAGLLYLATTDSALVVGALAGAFVLPAPIAGLRWLRDRDWRALAGSGAVAAALWIPWFPSSLNAVFGRRGARIVVGSGREALATYLPLPTWVVAAIGGAAAAWLITRRMDGRQGASVRFSAAASLAVAGMNDAQLNRWLPFALVALIAAPMSGRSRLLAFGLCCVSGAAWWRLTVLGVDAFAAVAMQAPLVLVWLVAAREQ